MRKVASASSPAYSADLLDADLIHAQLVLSLADQVRDRNHLVVDQALGELVEVVVALAAFEQIAQDHRVGEGTGQIDPGAAECKQVILDILADLLDGRIGQDRAQGIESRLFFEQGGAPGPAHGQVISLTGLP